MGIWRTLCSGTWLIYGSVDFQVLVLAVYELGGGVLDATLSEFPVRHVADGNGLVYGHAEVVANLQLT